MEVNTGLTYPVIFSLAFNSNGHCFAGTQSGGVFRSVESTTSVKEINGMIPSLFALYQNHPNPFNPITTIKYQIADLPAGRQGLILVTLKVYDVLGNEIAILVNEEKPVGYYEIEFNAYSLPSGIYFYRLQAGEFIQVKKMILLK
jgi:hypothetical protein